LAEGDEPASLVLLRSLGINVDFDALERTLDEAEEKIVRAATKVRGRQAASMAAHAAAIFKTGSVADVNSAEVRFQDEMQGAIYDELEALYDAGVDALGSELKGQGVDQPEEPGPVERSEELGILEASALTSARVLADRMLTTWQDLVRGQMRAGTNDASVVRDALEGLSDAEIRKRAGLSTSEAFGAGRRAAGRANKDRIRHYINAEVMDQNTCAACAGVDSKVVRVEEAGQYQPYMECAGGHRCRGQLISVVRE
jgi:hypothetical protein